MAAGRLRRFLRLPPRDMALAAAATVLLAGAVVALRMLPCRAAMALFGQRARREGHGEEAASRAVRRGATVVRPARCLAQALAYIALARATGAPGELVIGARKSRTGAFEAHAWIEHRGRV